MNKKRIENWGAICVAVITGTFLFWGTDLMPACTWSYSILIVIALMDVVYVDELFKDRNKSELMMISAFSTAFGLLSAVALVLIEAIFPGDQLLGIISPGLKEASILKSLFIFSIFNLIQAIRIELKLREIKKAETRTEKQI
jgi:hypothetical protein